MAGPPFQRSSPRYRCQLPSILKWVWRVRASWNRKSRCLPRGTTSSRVVPVTDAVASDGHRTSLSVMTSPAKRSCSRRAASQTVSPSGISDPRCEVANRLGCGRSPPPAWPCPGRPADSGVIRSHS